MKKNQLNFWVLIMQYIPETQSLRQHPVGTQGCVGAQETLELTMGRGKA